MALAARRQNDNTNNLLGSGRQCWKKGASQGAEVNKAKGAENRNDQKTKVECYFVGRWILLYLGGL